MKSKYKLILFLTIFFLFIKPVHADTSISLVCPNQATVSSTIDCSVIVNSNIELSAISTKLKVSNNLELIKFTTDPSWQGTGENGNIELYTYPNQKGKINLGLATIKVKDNSNTKTGTISLESTIYYLANFSGIPGNSAKTNIKILSSNNNLSNITLNKGTLTPTFNKNILNYKLTIDSDTIMISATTEDKNATITGNGLKELKYGENNFTITVTSEAGTKKEYKLNITRPPKKEEEKKEETTPPSNKEESTDNNNQTNSSNQKPTTPNQTPKEIPKLKELTISDYQLDFSKDITTYYLTLLPNEEKLNINAIPNSENIKVTITGNDKLTQNQNEILITLENPQGEKNIYKIIATKQDNICIVKDIKIKDYSLNFNCNQYEYNLEIKEESNLNIEVIPLNENTQINIYNNNNLKNNDIITILLKQDNNEYKYSIKIIKNSTPITNIINNKKELILIIITILCLIYLIIRTILKKKTTLKNK